EADKLLHCAKKLIDILLKAERGEVQLFKIKSEKEFFDETKKIIQRLSAEDYGFEQAIKNYLYEIIRRDNKEVLLAQELFPGFSSSDIISKNISSPVKSDMAVVKKTSDNSQILQIWDEYWSERIRGVKVIDKKALRAILKGKAIFYYIDKESLLAAICLAYQPTSKKFLYIYSVDTDRKFKGLRCGRQLVKELISDYGDAFSFGANLDYQGVRLGAQEEWEKLFIGLGFKLIGGKDDNYYFRKATAKHSSSPLLEAGRILSVDLDTCRRDRLETAGERVSCVKGRICIPVEGYSFVFGRLKDNEIIYTDDWYTCAATMLLAKDRNSREIKGAAHLYMDDLNNTSYIHKLLNVIQDEKLQDVIVISSFSGQDTFKKESEQERELLRLGRLFTDRGIGFIGFMRSAFGPLNRAWIEHNSCAFSFYNYGENAISPITVFFGDSLARELFAGRKYKSTPPLYILRQKDIAGGILTVSADKLHILNHGFNKNKSSSPILTQSGINFDDMLKKLWDVRTSEGAFNYLIENLKKRDVSEFRAICHPERMKHNFSLMQKKDTLVYKPYNYSELNFNSIADKYPNQRLFILSLENGFAHFYININPTHPYQFMLVPNPQNEHPQFMNKTALAMALEVMAISKGEIYFGFNSWGAWASLNHLHLHGFYSPYGKYPVENAQVDKYATIGDSSISIPKDYAAGFVLFEGKKVMPLIETAIGFINYLQDFNVPHNILIAKPNKIYVFVKSEEGKTAFYEKYGYLELSGEIIINGGRYEVIQRGDIVQEMQRVTLCKGDITGLIDGYLSRRSQVRNAIASVLAAAVYAQASENVSSSPIENEIKNLIIHASRGEVKVEIQRFSDGEICPQALNYELLNGADIDFNHSLDTPQDLVQAVLLMDMMKFYGVGKIRLFLDKHYDVANDLYDTLHYFTKTIRHNDNGQLKGGQASFAFTEPVAKKGLPIHIDNVLYQHRRLKYDSKYAAKGINAHARQIKIYKEQPSPLS
ncbi:MAG: hypothetical protein PHY56_07500, partial [Candidatus Omnitrophica bacterium]|nr:hypothetical protein [Candidatus Omnitrophota bacterium]